MLFFPLLFSCIEDEEINTEQDFAEMTVECGNVLALSNGMVVEKRDSFYVFQGDIYFTEDDIRQLKGSTRGGFYSGANRWSYVILYDTENGFSKTCELNEAIAHWEEATNLTFVRRTASSSNEPYIKFYNSPNGSYTYGLGKPVHGSRDLYISNTASYGTIIHEIGHALGLTHEQCRSDRDNYIDILESNIKADRKSQYSKISTYSSQYSIPFDFNSIMMYPSYNDDAIDPALPVMRKKNSNENEYFGGQRYGLSEEDCLLFNNYLYPSSSFKISGDRLLLSPTTATYSIQAPANSQVEWEITPSNAAHIVSGQFTNTVVVSVANADVSYSLSVRAVTNRNYVWADTMTIHAAPYPLIFGISHFKYCQSDGEYTLKAEVTDPYNSTVAWSSTDGTLYDLLYSDDASFLDTPHLYKAIDFYYPGHHSVTVTAMNSCNSSTYTGFIETLDYKHADWSMALYPNPSRDGILTIRIDENGTRNRNDSDIPTYNMTLYLKGKIVYSAKLKSKTEKLDFSKLSEGEYVLELQDSQKNRLFQPLVIGNASMNK